MQFEVECGQYLREKNRSLYKTEACKAVCSCNVCQNIFKMVCCVFWGFARERFSYSQLWQTAGLRARAGVLDCAVHVCVGALLV